MLCWRGFEVQTPLRVPARDVCFFYFSLTNIHPDQAGKKEKERKKYKKKKKHKGKQDIMISLWQQLEEAQATDWQTAGKLELPPPTSPQRVVNVNYFLIDESKVDLHFICPWKCISFQYIFGVCTPSAAVNAQGKLQTNIFPW